MMSWASSRALSTSPRPRRLLRYHPSSSPTASPRVTPVTRNATTLVPMPCLLRRLWGSGAEASSHGHGTLPSFEPVHPLAPQEAPRRDAHAPGEPGDEDRAPGTGPREADRGPGVYLGRVGVRDSGGL